jgi:hypothetical protein
MPKTPLRADGADPTPEQIEMMVRLKGEPYPFRTMPPRIYTSADEVCMVRKVKGMFDVAIVLPGGGVIMRGRLERIPE